MSTYLRTCLLALCALTSGCLSGDLTRVRAFEKIDAERIAALEVGVSRLADCLQELGAPLDVYQHEGTGVAVSYGWFHSLTWGVSLSIPLGDSSGSLNYTDQRDRMRGLLLFFDGTYTLRSVQEGFLNDLAGQISDAPPDVVDD